MNWKFGGYTFITFAGTLLHFMYAWLGKSVFIAPFTAVNESTWEHMKLLFFPTMIYFIITCVYKKDKYDNLWCSALVYTVTELSLIPLLFYTYIGIFGTAPAPVNILIFFVAPAIAFPISSKVCPCKIPPLISVLVIIFIGVLFAVFTFFPPHIPLFCDPVTGTYGLQ